MIELDEDVRERIAREAYENASTMREAVRDTIDAVLSHLNAECAAMFEKPDPYLVLAREVCQAFIDAADSRGAEEAAIADYLRKRDERLIEAIEPYREQSYFGGPIIARLKAEMAKS